MESTVIKIIEEYLEWENVKQQRGYSDDLRLEYDNDARYYLEHYMLIPLYPFGQYIKHYWRSKPVGKLIKRPKVLRVC